MTTKKPSTINGYIFNSQVQIFSKNSPRLLPASFKGQLTVEKDQVILIPDDIRFTGHVVVPEVKTVLFECDGIMVFDCNHVQSGAAWIDHETIAIADGMRLLILTIGFSRPEVWFQAGSGVRYINDYVGKIINSIASVDSDKYMVIHPYVFKTELSNRLPRQQCDHVILRTILNIPGWTLTQVQSDSNEECTIYTSPDNVVHIEFNDGSNRYLFSRTLKDKNAAQMHAFEIKTAHDERDLTDALRQHWQLDDFRIRRMATSRRSGRDRDNVYVVKVHCTSDVFNEILAAFEHNRETDYVVAVDL